MAHRAGVVHVEDAATPPPPPPQPLVTTNDRGAPIIHLHVHRATGARTYVKTGDMAVDLAEVERRAWYFSWSAYLLCALGLGVRVATFVLAFIFNAGLLGGLCAGFVFVELLAALAARMQVWGGLWIAMFAVGVSAGFKGVYIVMLFTLYGNSVGYYTIATRFLTLAFLITHMILDLGIFVCLVNLATGKLLIATHTAHLRHAINTILGREPPPDGFDNLWHMPPPPPSAQAQ